MQQAHEERKKAAAAAKAAEKAALDNCIGQLRQVKEALLAEATKAGKKPRRGTSPKDISHSMQQAGEVQAAMQVEEAGEPSDKAEEGKAEYNIVGKLVEQARAKAVSRSQPYIARQRS